MTNSILEITDSEYLIKLNRSNFDLSFIRSLLKMVEVSKPAKAKLNDADSGFYNHIVDRHIEPSEGHSSEPDYYSNLDEK
ncbi:MULTISPECIES: hypothetical protein [Mucilaginibacter]|uniref:hypothetical protein n=1 Tax=Mucilaginibacter TaxID=423349 RepID=UPI002090E11F|nr:MULTISPECIES: hypothetical protein [Mucilaginibacter]MCO5935414.1 hypothetical protein [Mucilaginibacter aurantiaciroseus]MEB0260212.1 hypothetical protein [Mucilaginibacter sp. 10I4]MEB0277377.1 hypothetical protein [Mucilaginibacter sp. 10B2]MEB0300141.1 hypothetical protein [Mucilaginibacter sp. 5C4]WPX25501.1 hypothetical protein RHM67_09510 [Mucilaginibacter sp. 5C4]